jgi:hypothetical protein
MLFGRSPAAAAPQLAWCSPRPEPGVAAPGNANSIARRRRDGRGPVNRGSDGTWPRTQHRPPVPFAGRQPSPDGAIHSFRSAGRLLGRLTAILDRFDTADARLGEAASLEGDRGARPWLAHALIHYAEALAGAAGRAASAERASLARRRRRSPRISGSSR